MKTVSLLIQLPIAKEKNKNGLLFGWHICSSPSRKIEKFSNQIRPIKYIRERKKTHVQTDMHPDSPQNGCDMSFVFMIPE